MICKADVTDLHNLCGSHPIFNNIAMFLDPFLIFLMCLPSDLSSLSLPLYRNFLSLVTFTI